MKEKQRWRITPGEPVRLSEIDPGATDGLPEKEAAKAGLRVDGRAIDALQEMLHAERQRALLVILQGMDTSGKDGTIKNVFHATGPLGVTVTAFLRPSQEELAHDFLWRVHAACPPRGTIGIFNRSHYEDVTAGLVRGLAPERAIKARYDEINAFEALLESSGTTVLKFFLHISPEEQAKRLQARLDRPDKRWKFDPGDLEDRALFARYMEAYEIALTRCTTDNAPWYVIPSDRKWARNAAIAQVVRQTLEAMNPRPPEVAWDPSDFKIV